MTSYQWRHRYCITEKCHETNVTRFFQFGPTFNQNFWLRQWASYCIRKAFILYSKLTTEYASGCWSKRFG